MYLPIPVRVIPLQQKLVKCINWKVSVNKGNDRTEYRIQASYQAGVGVLLGVAV